MQNNFISWRQPSKIGAALGGDYSGETKTRKTSHSEARRALPCSQVKETTLQVDMGLITLKITQHSLHWSLCPVTMMRELQIWVPRPTAEGKKHIHLFAGWKEETLLQISFPHRDSIPEQSHSKVISGWIGHWVSLDCSLLIQSLAHGCHSIISKAEMRNWRARGVILQLCFLTSLLPVNIATQMMRVTSEPFLRSDSKCLWVRKPWWLTEKSGMRLISS